MTLFPGLGPLVGPATVPSRPKRALRVEHAFDVTPTAAGSPAAVIFPRVAHAERSRLTPLDPGEALLELAPNVLLTDPACSQSHFDVLAALVAETPCWRLDTGRDVARVAMLLAECRCG